MPTRRGVAVLGLGAAMALSGWALGVEDFVLVALSAATLVSWGALGVHVQARRARKTLATRAEGPRRQVAVGDDAVATVEVRNTGRRSLSMLVVAALEPWNVSYPGLLGGRSATRARAITGERPVRDAPPVRSGDGVRSRRTRWQRLGELGPGSDCTIPMAIPTARRGVWSLPGIRLSCTDALGLAALPVGRASSIEVVVVPRPAPELSSPLDEGGPGAAGRRRGGGDTEGPVAPGGDEFAGLRPYVAGDRLTRLHWPSMARTGDLLVRDFVEPIEGLAEVVVDDRARQVEQSVAEAAALGTALLRGGVGVVVRTTGGERLVVPPGPAARGTLLQALAMVRGRS